MLIYVQNYQRTASADLLIFYFNTIFNTNIIFTIIKTHFI